MIVALFQVATGGNGEVNTRVGLFRGFCWGSSLLFCCWVFLG